MTITAAQHDKLVNLLIENRAEARDHGIAIAYRNEPGDTQAKYQEFLDFLFDLRYAADAEVNPALDPDSPEFDDGSILDQEIAAESPKSGPLYEIRDAWNLTNDSQESFATLCKFHGTQADIVAAFQHKSFDRGSTNWEHVKTTPHADPCSVAGCVR